MSMTLVSIQVGTVQTHTLPDGTEWTTAFFKTPVTGDVQVNPLTVEGDEQHHRKFHGGEHRAVLMYSADHYARWQQERDFAFPLGAFGENFTVSGIDENSACIGDQFAIGEAVILEVTQPREPCAQINKRWNMPTLMKDAMRTQRSGWYCRVLKTGIVHADMSVTRIANPYPEWTIANAAQTYEKRISQPEKALSLAQCPALEPGWRVKLAKAAQ